MGVVQSDTTRPSAAAQVKQQLRRRFAEHRRGLAEAERSAARAAVRSVVLDRAAAGWRCVAGYQPMESEPGSVELLAGLRDLGIRLLVPLTLADRDLDWVEWTPAGCGPPLGLHAVAVADAVLVPALAVAADGTRLGRGGGSYDRALPRRRADAPAVALLHSRERVDTLPAEPWDVPVDAVVTPEGWDWLR